LTSDKFPKSSRDKTEVAKKIGEKGLEVEKKKNTRQGKNGKKEGGQENPNEDSEGTSEVPEWKWGDNRGAGMLEKGGDRLSAPGGIRKCTI